jgi:hypothetical protein
MGKIFTSDDFLKKAKEIWKDEYDYSNVVFIDEDTEVIIICKKDGHGEFEKKPKQHVLRSRPAGCIKCGRERQIEKATKPFAVFLDEAREIHGELYDYVEESYNGSKPEMIIICKKDGHEPFPQSPDVHINAKGGCPTCANELTGERCRLKYDEVINRLNENSKENNTTVSFEEEEYLGVNANLIIKCSKHGVQDARLANSMLHQTHPCLKCSSEILNRSFEIRSTENVIQFLDEKFDGKYKIYDFKYEDKRTVIKFNCPIEGHGDFSFQVDSMYTSNGCPVCSYENSIEKRTESVRKHNESTRKSRELKWIQEVKVKHDCFYDYSLVEYVNAKIPVKIICPNHGVITQTPNDHRVSGCRDCADEELKGTFSKKYFDAYPDRKELNAMVYYIKFTYKEEIFYKVGITRTTINKRFGSIDKKVINIDVIKTLSTTLYNAWQLEVIIQNTHGDKFRYRPVIDGGSIKKYRIGPSECFSKPLSKQLIVKYF